MTQDLYTSADVSKVRALLYKEQQGKCALSGVEFPLKDFHTDHRHDEEQLVRAALYKQSNMALGKLEGLWTRYLAYWYPSTLPEFLRAAADYLERSEANPDTRWRHVGWIKKIQTKFNKLTATQQNTVLQSLDRPNGKNPAERKKYFLAAVKSKVYGYDIIRNIINAVVKE
jgi:N-glycosylase/DNA lyase